MKRLMILVVVCIISVGGTFAKEGFEGRPINNNIWIETGNTLNRGEFSIGLGSSIGFGISDRVQVGTNILAWLVQYYNANVKFEFLNNDVSSLAIGVSVGKFNMDVFGAEEDFNSITPFAAYSHKISPNTTFHLEGKLSSFGGDVDIDLADPEASIDGSAVSAGLEYSWSNKTKFLTEGGYDLTFEAPKFGGAVLWGWEKFRLKLGVSYYAPEGADPFTLPVVGLWWRFDG